MVAIKPALEIFDKFITIAKELSKLPQLVLPQYRAAATDLYEISQKLLTSTENISRWLYKFLYFDFLQQDARTRFLDLLRDYKTMKQGPEFRHLKFNCSDISAIYHRNIQKKLGNWLSNQSKLEEVHGIFTALSNSDRDLVAFAYETVIKNLDSALDDIEKHTDVGAMNDAEDRRLQLKRDMKDITSQLENFSGELSELVISFASLAHTPVTLGRQ